MIRLKISKLIKADLVGPVYNLLKGACKSCVELEYNMEECYRALSDQLDWNNPEGNCCPYDLNKPLPLHESRGRLTNPADFFFNNDLEYLRGGSTNIKYTASITKTKAAKYETEGIEDMVPKLWSPTKGVQEISVRRAYHKLYKFMEGDYPRLHLNDIKDMLLLIAQNKLNNLDGNVIVHLAMGLRMYTRRILIQKRVEDLQLGVESYQKKLNISKPHTHDVDLSRRVLYTTYSEPQGVIYEDKLKRKRLMRTVELYKFSDGTLTSVCNTLDQMLKNLSQQLLERRITRSLEKFVGGRDYETDYRLLQRTLLVLCSIFLKQLAINSGVVSPLATRKVHVHAMNGFEMPLPVAVCSGLVNPLAPRKGKFHGGLITISTLCT
ncbi:hypothetical protein Tco_1266098 [Tanacetum coccineum]